VNKADFFQNLAEYSQAKGFSLFIAGDALEDPKEVSRGVRIALSAIYAIAGGAIGGGLGVGGAVVGGALGAGLGIPGYSKAQKDELISDLQRLSPYGDLIAICLGGWTLLRVAIDADDFSEDALVTRFSLIHERAHDFRKYALSTLTGKVSTFAEVLVVFSLHERAKHFTERLASKCKHISRWKSVRTYPWTIDLEREEITGGQIGIVKVKLGMVRGDHRAALFRRRQ